jgi:uncharacterized protein (DUF1778 family)
MKKKTDSPELPTISKEEIQKQFPKTEAILLRLSVQDKQAITDAAKSLHLTATEYLVKCHAVVAAKLAVD